MNLQTIRSLFTLFSGEEDVTTYLPLLTAAQEEVVQSLKQGADSTDSRLNYLAAAIANLRYMQLFGAREKAAATFAGTLRRATDADEQLRFAEQLVYAYRGLCRDLTETADFVFTGIGG